MKWVQPRFTPDGQLITDPMIGTYDDKPVGSPKWAEAMARHVQGSHGRMVQNGNPNYLCKVIRDALAASPHPWEVYPEEAKGDPEVWMRMVTGKPLAEVLSYVRRIDAKAGQELMELLALKLSAEQMEVVEAGLWFDLGEDPEALARAIRRQFPVERIGALVKALQSPELRVSRQEADRLRKRALRGTDLAARACEHCGKVFEPKRSQARFCGGSCRAKASQERKEAPAAPAKRQFIEVDAKEESAAAVEPAVVVRRKAPSPEMRKVAAERLRGFAQRQREDADSSDPETAATCRSEATQAELAAMKLEHPRQSWEVTGMVLNQLEWWAEAAEGEAEGLLGEGSIGDTFKGPATEAEAKEARALLADAKAYRACAEWLLG